MRYIILIILLITIIGCSNNYHQNYDNQITEETNQNDYKKIILFLDSLTIPSDYYMYKNSEFFCGNRWCGVDRYEGEEILTEIKNNEIKSEKNQGWIRNKCGLILIKKNIEFYTINDALQEIKEIVEIHKNDTLEFNKKINCNVIYANIPGPNRIYNIEICLNKEIIKNISIDYKEASPHFARIPNHSWKFSEEYPNTYFNKTTNIISNSSYCNWLIEKEKERIIY